MTSYLYKGLDRAALDAGYNARATVPDITPYLDACRSKTDRAKKNLSAKLSLQYGPGSDETFDYYNAGSNAPLFVYIHGGYWRALGAEDSGFMAENMVAHGISVAVLNYSLAPAVNLDEIVRQMRLALSYLWHNAGSLGFKKDRLYVSGSSAGGHLGAMMLGEKWLADFNLSQSPVAGAILISGIYDIKPLQLCHINDWMNFDDDMVIRNSPSVHLPGDCPPILITCGGDETSEFKRQAEDYAGLLKGRGLTVDHFEVPARNHFDIVLEMADADSMFFRKIKKMILDA